ncbi:hypothetical protein LRS13_23255 [Svornostia abyssi]|uniref:Uncharacterized protein n=1 Tax=Svornostia abyssi TaxID=2898438 RepID=A0ABY5PG62_9ACTN|nr:hypothetical protein LRS13_23255 [Parviterribacteraceae bacterium J379]
MRLLLPSVVALTALAVAASGASAATTIGSDLARAAGNSPCYAGMTLPMNCTIGNASIPSGSQAAGGLTAPAPGVVVRWRLKHATAASGTTVRLVVMGGNTVRARGSAETLPTAAATETFTTRLPITTGDRVTVSAAGPNGSSLPVIYQDNASSRHQWFPQLTDGETRAPSATHSNYEVLLNADVEADADGDGYGDETQDACPSKASTQGTCPAAPADPAPTATPTPEATTPAPATTSPLQLPQTPTADPTVPVTLGRAPTRADARGRVAVRLGCETADQACSPRVELFHGTGARRTRLVRTQPVIAAGQDRTLQLQLPVAARRMLRARRALTVQLVVTPDTGTPVRRTLRLRAP